LLFPALALAVNAGVRLLRVPLVSARESFRAGALRESVPARLEPDLPETAVAFPLRLPQAPLDGFAVRAPLAECEPPGRLPFPLALLGLPEPQRLFEAERELAPDLVPAERESIGLRAVRVLPDDCAGLRLRACGAGRLKCERAAAGLPLLEA
jgi:hypothetical protein